MATVHRLSLIWIVGCITGKPETISDPQLLKQFQSLTARSRRTSLPSKSLPRAQHSERHFKRMVFFD